MVNSFDNNKSNDPMSEHDTNNIKRTYPYKHLQKRKTKERLERKKRERRKRKRDE